ncbi:hypothetical protein ABBQ38_002177 [Trebouxia sp. C0009 RCD-2024]
MVSPAGHFHKQVLPFEPPWWFQQVARDPLFVWTDLTEKDLQSLRQFGLGSPNSAAILQKAATQSLSRTDSQQGIELDLYVQTLRQGKGMSLTDKQVSALFSLVKTVHTQAVLQRLTIDKSFDCFKQALLRHSVHRPPYSLGLFTLVQAQAITQWFLRTYYMHYKLYQYAFTNRVSCNVSSAHPGDAVELPLQLLPLREADTEEQHQSSVETQQKQEEAAAAKAAEEKTAQDEIDRQQRIKDSFDAQMPDEISQKVQAALQKEMERLQLVMSAQFAKQEAVLKKRVTELEQKAVAAGVQLQ